MIAFDTDFERKKISLAMKLDILGLMSDESAVDAQVPGVLKLVEVSSLVLSPVWLQESLEFLGEIFNHIKINSLAREGKREIGRERERDKNCICLACLTHGVNQRDGGWVRGLFYLIFYPEVAKVLISSPKKGFKNTIFIDFY